MKWCSQPVHPSPLLPLSFPLAVSVAAQASANTRLPGPPSVPTCCLSLAPLPRGIERKIICRGVRLWVLIAAGHQPQGA